MTVELTLNGDLTIERIEAVATATIDPKSRLATEKVILAADARKRLAAMRTAAEAAIAADPERPIYGFNRGFGSNVSYAIRPDEARKLQVNLIVSHAANVGPLTPRDVVRATMLLRAQSLARGHSTVRPKIVDALIEMLNNGVTPAVPRHGSVSASGDLAPLSHIAAVVIGRGRIMLDERGRAAFEGAPEAVETELYLKKAADLGLPVFSPVEDLQMKEGLALNNGCQYSTAWAALTAAQMRRLVKTAALSTALGVQAMIGSGRPFRASLHDLRPHPGSKQIAAWVSALLHDYPFLNVTADEKADFDGDIQDPYNLRCAAQILGPCLELVERAEATLAREANAVTDNPIDLNEDAAKFTLENIVSGGHFHGMPVAVDAYGLLQAAGIMARLSNMRCVRYVDAKRNKGLGPQLRGNDPDATESGLLIAEYATAGLCNHIWGLAMPSHLMSMSTDSGQEDHVSMAANVAMRAHEAAARLADVLAIELAFASQALDRRQKEGVTTRSLDDKLGPEMDKPSEHVWTESPDVKRAGRAPLKRTVKIKKEWTMALAEGFHQPGTLTAPAIREIREAFPLVEKDQELSWKMMKLAAKVLSGAIVEATGLQDFKRH